MSTVESNLGIAKLQELFVSNLLKTIKSNESEKVIDTLKMQENNNPIIDIQQLCQDIIPINQENVGSTYISIPVKDLPNPEDIGGGWIKMWHVNGLNYYRHESGIITWSKPYTVLDESLHKHKIPPDAVHDIRNNKNFNRVENAIYGCYIEAAIINQCKIMGFGDESVIENKNMRDFLLMIYSTVNHDIPIPVVPVLTEPDVVLKETRTTRILGNGKTPVSFLMEYCLKILSCEPKFVQYETGDEVYRYTTEVHINGQMQAKCSATNKKKSKQDASLLVIQKFCPKEYPITQIQERIIPVIKTYGSKKLRSDDPDLCIPGISDKTPSVVLHEFCTRENIAITFDIVENEDKNLKKRFTALASIPGFKGVGYGKNKKEAKQRSHQHILLQMHPDLEYWDDILDFHNQDKNNKKKPISYGIQFDEYYNIEKQIEQYEYDKIDDFDEYDGGFYDNEEEQYDEYDEFEGGFFDDEEEYEEE
eukprot:TRINITY_DN6714_c0_g1_i1.p1 TRINITY_DN6714_c0_g1~~TRINITY_DN6714_c0_g1_i1.p1  ORF type:complete len:477 (+),score=119.87 TRINITY_DN6714_c0_g1_i1:1-1431(+)